MRQSGLFCQMVRVKSDGLQKTIGYKLAIVEKTGSSILNITRGDYLCRLLDYFHMDRPKGHRGIPTWNLYWIRIS